MEKVSGQTAVSKGRVLVRNSQACNSDNMFFFYRPLYWKWDPPGVLWTQTRAGFLHMGLVSDTAQQGISFSLIKILHHFETGRPYFILH